jgi:arabinogalactan oligomer/maltooligosaccharide transport system permease protein
MIGQREAIGEAPPLVGTAVRPEARGLAGLRRRHARKQLRRDERVALWASRIFILIFMALVIFPALWVVGSSFQPGIVFNSTTVIPSSFTLQHYQDLFANTGFLTWVRNSVIVCTAVGAITVLLVATMAYAFSRFRFTGRRYGLMFLLLVQMFPAQMSFIAFYYLLLQIHLLDTLVGLILVFIGSGLPFNAWLFKGYIDSLPRDLEEAAYVDGASKLQAYLRVILPLTRPMMAVIFIFVWFGLYSEYLVSSWLLTTQSNFTVPLGLYQFLNNGFLSNWTEFAAGAVLGTIPLMIIFLAMQRFLVAGLARGAVKG